MDTSRLGQFVAQFMEQVSADWPEGSTISDVAIVVDMELPDGEEIILTACTDTRRWVQAALLDEAIETVSAPLNPVEEE